MIYREDYDNAQDYVNAKIRARRRKIRLTILVILLLIAGTLVFLYEYYKVRTVTVEGNSRYTNEEISDMVTKGLLGNNSLVLSFRYRNKQISDIPFIEKISVNVASHDTIKIVVYEKSLAGYVSFLGSNFYFGRDGTVVETSGEALEGVPRVTGLSFDQIVLYQKLPVEDDSIFERILDTTQLLSKYSLDADSIYFESDGDMNIYFGDVRVAMGNDDYADEKLSNVSKILPSLEGRGEGTLQLTNYTPSSAYITFVVKDGLASQIDSATGSDVATQQATATAIAQQKAEEEAAAKAAAQAQEQTTASETTEATQESQNTGEEVQETAEQAVEEAPSVEIPADAVVVSEGGENTGE